MKKWVLIYEGLAGETEIKGEEPIGSYLKAYNPDAYNGRGWSDWTFKLSDAMLFDSAIEALELWKTQSTVVPLRYDGKPNRPLTAFSVTTEAREV